MCGSQAAIAFLWRTAWHTCDLLTSVCAIPRMHNPWWRSCCTCCQVSPAVCGLCAAGVHVRCLHVQRYTQALVLACDGARARFMSKFIDEQTENTVTDSADRFFLLHGWQNYEKNSRSFFLHCRFYCCNQKQYPLYLKIILVIPPSPPNHHDHHRRRRCRLQKEFVSLFELTSCAAGSSILNSSLMSKIYKGNHGEATAHDRIRAVSFFLLCLRSINSCWPLERSFLCLSP